MEEKFGCTGCDYITSVEKNGIIKCLKVGNTENCCKENFIFKNGEKVSQKTNLPIYEDWEKYWPEYWPGEKPQEK